jgi:hypothetical protein
MRLLLCLVLLGGCGARPAAPAAKAPQPRLVVLVVVDQLPSWVWDARASFMRHGLARVQREGFVWRRARYPYAATFTAPGHAALGTGAPPSVTGILANAWYRRDLSTIVDSTWDPKSPRLDVEADIGTSPELVRVDGVGDMVVARGGKSVGVGVKDRGALLPAGRKPTLAVWFDSTSGRFTTSRWYSEQVPAWVSRLTQEKPIPPRARGYLWEPLDPAFLAAHAMVPDDAPGEDEVAGRTFPHRFPQSDEAIELATKASPLGLTATRELAEAAIEGERLGFDDVPDLLTVSFAALDYVGHRWGQESWEALDMLLRVDAELGQLWQTLDEKVGKGQWAAIVTTDHGVARMVEHTGGVRVRVPDVSRAVGETVLAAREPYVWLRERPTDAELDAMVERVRAVPGIGGAWRTDRLTGGCAARPEPERSVCWSIDPERAGDIYFAPAAGSIIYSKEFDPTTHGSPNPDDVYVPVMLLAPGVASGRSDDEVSILRVAPTLAALLGVNAPPAATEAPLR